MKTKTKFRQTVLGMIPEEWEVKTIDQIKSSDKNAVSTGPFGSKMKREFFVKQGVPIIKGGNLTSYRFIDEDFEYLPEEKADELKSAICHPRDIVITYVGTLGQVGIIPKKSKYKRYVISQSGLKLTCDESCAISEYVFYFLKSSTGQHFLLLNKSQTGVPIIAQPSTSLKNIPIPIPEISEQKKIVKVLDDLSDKIDLLHMNNYTLEIIGQEIFKHWFIDFEFPNNDGKPYKSSGGKMIYNKELRREIPQCWKLGNLGDLANNQRRVVKPRDIEGNMPYIGLEHMPRGSIALSNWDSVDEVISHKYQFNKGEILFGKLRPYFHKVGIATIDGVCSTDILVITPKSPEWQNVVLFHVSSSKFVNYANASSTGTRMPRSDWDSMSRYPILIPEKHVANMFDKTMKPLIKKIHNNIIQLRNLTKTRDLVLPKLMSGKIRVPVEVKK